MSLRRTITEADIRRYSRRGNYHSDASAARALGLPGLVAQGVQVAGPAYGALLDAWGDDFLDHGEIDVRFVGVVLADETIDSTVAVDGDHATIEVRNATSDRMSVVGHASRTAG